MVNKSTFLTTADTHTGEDHAITGDVQCLWGVNSEDVTSFSCQLEVKIGANWVMLGTALTTVTKVLTAIPKGVPARVRLTAVVGGTLGVEVFLAA